MLWLTKAAGVAWSNGTVLTIPIPAPVLARNSSAIVVRSPSGGSPGSQEMLPESVLNPVARAVAAEAESVAGPGGKAVVGVGAHPWPRSVLRRHSRGGA